MLAMADIHSSTSFSDLVTNQKTLSPGLLPTAMTCSIPTLAGRVGREGILTTNCPSMMDNVMDSSFQSNFRSRSPLEKVEKTMLT